MASSDGLSKQEEYLRLPPHHPKCTRKLDWSCQSCPDKWAWKLWEKTFTEAIYNEQGRLRTVLGKWTRDTVGWIWRYHESYLYHQENNQWKRAPVVQQDRHLHTVTCQFLLCELPINAKPVTDAIKTATTIMYTPPVSIAAEDNTEETQPAMFMELLNHLPEWEREILQSIEYHFDEEGIVHILKSNNKLYFVSNGGESDRLGYFSWVIATNMEILVTNHGQAKGNQEQIESLHTESVAALSPVSFLNRLCMFHNVSLSNEECIQLSNNKTIVRHIQWYHKQALLTPTYCLTSDFVVQIQIESDLTKFNAT
eukprot:6201960-Ditylum_brightwellii.AAC.1